MFLLLLAFASGCNLNTFSSCYEKSRDPAKCIRSSECIENELEVKLYSSRVHLKGFKVFDQAREAVKDLIGCDLKAYENCFNSTDIKTIGCLIDIDCLDFTDIGELSQEYFYSFPLEGYGNFYYQNTYQNTYQNVNQNTNTNTNTNIPQNAKEHHTENSDENNDSILKDELGLQKNASVKIEDSTEINDMSLEILASKISEIYDIWELLKAANETDKVKYKEFFDKEGNLINIDIRLEVLYNAYRKKIRERVDQDKTKPFEDIYAEKPKNPIPINTPTKQTQDALVESFEDYLKQEDDENEFVPVLKPKTSTPTQTNKLESKNSELEENQKEFETLWHTPTADTTNLNKIETDRSKRDDIFNEDEKNELEINQVDEENDTLFDEDKEFGDAGQNQIQEEEEDSEFQPKLPNDDEDFADENKIEYDEALEESSEDNLQKKTEFLQETSCEEKCSEQCKTSENAESCTSQCIYDTCSSSKPATSDYITVIITGLLLFLVVSVIYIFIKSRGSRQVYDSYIKGHNA